LGPSPQFLGYERIEKRNFNELRGQRRASKPPQQGRKFPKRCFDSSGAAAASFSSGGQTVSELPAYTPVSVHFLSLPRGKLWMHRRSVDHPAIVQRKPGIMIWTTIA
jgi:hypothetical protein